MSNNSNTSTRTSNLNIHPGNTTTDGLVVVQLNDTEQQEAIAIAAAAARAEERAEQRALERAIQQKELLRRSTSSVISNDNKQQQQQQQQHAFRNSNDNNYNGSTSTTTTTDINNINRNGILFVSKKRRLGVTPDAANNDNDTNSIKEHVNNNRPIAVGLIARTTGNSKSTLSTTTSNNNNNNNNNNSNTTNDIVLSETDRIAIRQKYLGKTNVTVEESAAIIQQVASNQKNKKKNDTTTNNKKITFKFRWDETDDTFNDNDPLYNKSLMTNTTTTTTTSTSTATSSRQQQNQYYQQRYTTSNNSNNNRQQYHNNNNNNSNYSNTSRNNQQNSNKYQNNNNTITDTSNDVLAFKKPKKTKLSLQEQLVGTSSSSNNLATTGTSTNSNTKNTSGSTSIIHDILTKPYQLMTSRDWRIIRENYEITVKGGKAPPPMRSFYESTSTSTLSSDTTNTNTGNTTNSSIQIPQIHTSLLKSIETIFQFTIPSPIQRQAIPIGLQRRDLIGIAETGSGKTIAFGIPLCQYLLQLPISIINNVIDSGPLALIMAPTRELAIQIDIEITKLLSCQQLIRTLCIVGGRQSIQTQAQLLRNPGAHIVVGTPGRINDCIDMSYLVLNSCSYIVLDEADRMIDMGFAPQMESILNAMGGLLKSDNEQEAYQQEINDLQNNTIDVAQYRVTAMFSATMPNEVERIAKQYLRHPAIVYIGDPDSAGKNTRIIQKLVWVANPLKKEEALRTLLRDTRFIREKVIVFVNEKKHADAVGRMVERAGRQCVVLHGGKAQDQREDNLELFRKGGIVMVATDVAGRGLDIPDVAHIINYDLPTRSIENYTHRIGRTGRAGKIGYATSLISDDDEGIMSPLRTYLESTGNEVPERLKRHSSSQSSTIQNSILY